MAVRADSFKTGLEGLAELDSGELAARRGSESRPHAILRNSAIHSALPPKRLFRSLNCWLIVGMVIFSPISPAMTDRWYELGSPIESQSAIGGGAGKAIPEGLGTNPEDGIKPDSSGFDSGPSLVSTLVLGNNSLERGNYHSINPLSLGSIAFNQVDNQVDVLGALSSSLSVINATTDAVLSTIEVGAGPADLVVDQSNGDVLVTNSSCASCSFTGNAFLTIVSGPNDSDASASLPGVGPTLGIAYDNDSGITFIANETGLIAYNVTTQTIAAFTNLPGQPPSQVAYDSRNRQVLVTLPQANEISLVNSSSMALSSEIKLNFSPSLVAFDPHSNEIVVTNANNGKVELFNASSRTYTGSISVGGTPSGVIFDPNRDEMVVSTTNDTVTVLGSDPLRLIGNISSPGTPASLCIDPFSDYAFVSATSSGAVDIVDLNTLSLVGDVPLTFEPTGLAVDSWNGDVYVSDASSNGISVLGPSTDKRVGFISTHGDLGPLTFDGATGVADVIDDSNDSILFVNASAERVEGQVLLSAGLSAIAFDPHDGNIYVTNDFLDTITILNGVTGQVIQNVSLSDGPDVLLFDPALGVMVVGCMNSESIAEVEVGRGIIQRVPVGMIVGSLSYDPVSGLLLIGNWSAGPNLIEVNAKTLDVVGSLDDYTEVTSIAVDPYVGELFVTGYDGVLGWAVSVVAEVSGSVTPILGVPASPEDSVYDSVNGEVYVADLQSGAVSILDDGSMHYPVTFYEEGLLNGTLWNVSVGGLVLTTELRNLSFSLPNGTYPWSVIPIAGYNAVWAGNMTILGSRAQVTVVFARITYSLTFQETGLPDGTRWTVVLGTSSSSSTTSSISFQEPNGSYSYTIGGIAGWAPSTSEGALLVTGRSVVQLVVWSERTFPVTFTEEGLPSGTEWWVNASDGSSGSSVTRTVSLRVANGTYTYSVATTNKTYSSPAGLLTVFDGPVSVGVAFSRVVFSEVFVEAGLPHGTNWTVTLNGTSKTGTAEIVFAGIPNATYSFSIEAVPGFTSRPSMGTIVVTGANGTETVTFSAAPASQDNITPVWRLLGLPASVGYALVVGIAAVAVAALTVLLNQRRRKGPLIPARQGSSNPPSSDSSISNRPSGK
jgi:YVTN family beta-propeller protein